MMKRFGWHRGALGGWLLGGGVAWLLLYAPPQASGQGAAERVQQCLPQAQDTCIDWEKALAYATGQGAPAAWANSKAQKNISAVRAADLDAARNLVQLIQGVALDAETNVAGRMLQDERISARLQGRLRGVRRAEAPRYFSDGSASVRLEARLRDVIPKEWQAAQPLSRATGAAPLPVRGPTGSSLFRSSQPLSGVIIDASGLNLQPAISPRVLDPEGNPVFGAGYTTSAEAPEGPLGYVKGLEKARKHERVGSNPGIVKAQAVRGRYRADVVLSQQDADAVRLIWEQETILRQGRMLLVLD